MNNVVLAIIVGVAAGLAGGLLAGMTRAPRGVSPAGTLTGVDLTTLEARLDRIEALLQIRTEETEAALHGSGARERAAGPGGGLGDTEAVDALVERLDTRMRAAVAESIRSTWEELGATSAGPDPIAPPPKKKVTLAEAAAELALSAAEEDEVRRISEDTMEKVVALLGKDQEGGEAKVREDFQAAKDDPAKSLELMGTYMGRVMSNLGGFIQIGMDHDRKMKESIGPEKAARLENEYEISDLDPYGLEDLFSFGD